jgi:proline dehydrogenase
MLEFLDRLMTTSASLAYIAGPELKDAIAACNRFAQQGLTSTVGYWDKGEGADPREVADAYLQALAAISAEGLDSYLSIKAPPLQMSSTLVAEVVDRASEAAIGIHFDSLFPEVAERTFELVAESRLSHAMVGCTLPGRWRRSTDDARRAVELGAARVRVVKGQWPDPADPDLDTRQGFLMVIDALLAAKAAHVAVATHDPWLARESLRRLQSGGASCELELLFGLPMNAVTQVAAELRAPVRLYVPYGKSYMPYALSQLRRNPKVVWWFLRDTLATNLRGA